MRSAIALLFCLWLAAGAALAQTSEDKLRFGVAVTDEHGTPIRDLAATDFTVEGSGKPQAAELRGIKTGEAKPVAAGEFTNRNAAVLGRGLMVIVLDTVHTRWLDEKDVRPMIAKYMGTLAKRNTPVALLVMDPNGVMHSVHGFTTRSETLSAALERADALVHKRLPAGEASPEVAAETARLADFLKGTTANQMPPTEGLRVSPEWVLQMFRGVAEATAGIPGRKSLVWIMNTSPFEVADKTHLMASISNVLATDAAFRGVSSGTMSAPSGQRNDYLSADDIKKSLPLWKATFTELQRANVAVYPVGVRGSASTSLGDQTLHAMRTVAEMTGGRELHVVGDPFVQLADVPDQNLAAYDLAPAVPQGCKGEWCEVKITVKRPGAKVFAPTGFFRLASVKPDEVFTAATLTPLDFGGLPFVVHFTDTQAAGANKKVGFLVMFPPEAEVPPADSNQLNLEIVAQAIPLAGTIMKTQNYNAAGEVPAASVDQIRRYGFTLNNSIELAPGEYTVKFVVRDKATNRVGSVTVPLRVS